MGEGDGVAGRGVVAAGLALGTPAEGEAPDESATDGEIVAPVPDPGTPRTNNEPQAKATTIAAAVAPTRSRRRGRAGDVRWRIGKE